ncbi:MAG: alpha/beta hydrolase [Rhodocyclaceae bacterium]|nr:alpha/beta hydrolase [Rhodocyclaceae bacterium]
MKPSTSEFAFLRGRRLHLRVWGDAGASPIFFLHGFGDVSASFQFVVDALAREWRVVAPDWRGFGWSQWNGDAYWSPDYLADLDALLEQALPQEPVRLVGHSMGGNIAGLYAGIRPERVAGLVNLEGFGIRPAAPDEAPGRYRTWLNQVREAPRFRHYRNREEYAARLMRDNARLTPERAAFLAGHLAESEQDGVRTAMDPCHRWVNPVLYRLEEAKACWREVRCPVLFVRGDDSGYLRDYIAGEEDYRARLACFALAQEALVADCGHNLHHDQPEAVARLIEDFFA